MPWYRIERENLSTGDSALVFCWQGSDPEEYVEITQDAFVELSTIIAKSLPDPPIVEEAQVEEAPGVLPEPIDEGLTSQGLETTGTLTLKGLAIGGQEEEKPLENEKKLEDTNTLRVKQLLAARQPSGVVDEDGVEQG